MTTAVEPVSGGSMRLSKVFDKPMVENQDGPRLIFTSDYKMPLTIYGVAYSVNKVPRMAEVAHAEGWEMASHGCR